MSASGRPDLVITSYGPSMRPWRQIYELRLGDRVFTREVTERERESEEVGGFWQKAERLIKDAQALRVRAGEITSPGRVRRGDLEPAIEEEAWEKERALFVALFPDAEPFLLPASRVEREKEAAHDDDLREAQGFRRRVEKDGVTSVFDMAPRVTREMVVGGPGVLAAFAVYGGSAFSCLLCGALLAAGSERVDPEGAIERHREWHDVLVRTREIPVRH